MRDPVAERVAIDLQRQALAQGGGEPALGRRAQRSPIVLFDESARGGADLGPGWAATPGSARSASFSR